MENGEWRISGDSPVRGNVTAGDKRVRRPLQGDFVHTYFIIWCGCAAINSQFSILNSQLVGTINV